MPADVSIVAWDDSVLCEHTLPKLTALSHDVVAFGAHVARRLFDVVEGAEPAAFLNRIVRNLLIDRARRSATRGTEVAFDECRGPSVAPTQSDAIELEQTRARYQASVGALPNRTREVFLLHRVEGLTYKDIAELLSISIRTVEWHVAEAIVRIDRDLRK